MKRFLRVLLLFMSPIAFLLGFYVFDDPFMLFWPNEQLFDSYARKNCVNDAYRGIRWMNQYADSLHYNSFIIGSSRSDFYYVDEWMRYLDEDASCFHFNQSGDNLIGTVQRVDWLYKRFDRIDNILFVMDVEYLEDMTEHKGHLFRQPWQVTEEWDFFAFNMEFVRAFYSIDYQKQLLGINDRDSILPYYIIPQSNEVHKDAAEHMLDSFPDVYYSMLPLEYRLYERPSTEKVARPVIGNDQIVALNKLRQMLMDGHSDYRIVISPLYNQIALNEKDFDILCSIFDKDKVFDFSGKNEFTDNVLNYYECSHYRPQLCNIILKTIYD